ncbi:hypothetical protein GCM10011514_35130 [Emticicia aquatilis]|uniref:Uncharacterized protein n=2 Tax=Emticicia aquatilis TaxID=1537369 RepID=A0A917DSX0_9BACT|nr:hypothetical protein GCM10011514_35130 [Emticicia aquatilis]
MLVTLLACSSQTITPDVGSLDLKVTIGPLCPVEPCNKTTDDIRKVYEAYTFTVKEAKTGKVVLEKTLAYNGTNGVLKSTDMSVGEYELDFTPKSFFTKQGFPRPFTIEKNKTTQLEIAIDTGIR